jgi:hypothetical protein
MTTLIPGELLLGILLMGIGVAPAQSVSASKCVVGWL